ncbi:MAG: BlaI/MecI/CopY family transcriptional regulator [Bacteroidaceae bacterium]|nr:BlaI/MecI/CopY family transcriptional regulator [Bacteroidaceae bacterium]
MSILWNLPNNGGYTSDILSRYTGKKPAYTTLATFLKILSGKGFVKCTKRGNKLHFTPKVSKEDYAVVYLRPVKDAFFGGSLQEMIRFIIQKEQLSQEEVSNLLTQVQAAQ